ncbi:MAG: hypothetical protein IJZ76_07290 [Lachnospiraceae bacterium]|nr:hypothetical protein [Lachnospiraceae bacterium]
MAGQAYSVKDVEITKTTYTYKVKVVKDTNVFKYVKLGKAKVTNSAKSSETSSSSTYVSNRYLTGTSGKLNIKTNSTYEITSIVVMTYDKDGNQVYRNVDNKQTIAYGLNAYDSTLYDVMPGVDKNKKNFSRQLMKRTYVYVGYRNKHTGEYTKFAVKEDANKETYCEVEYQRPGVDYEGKPYTLNKNQHYGSLSTALSWYGGVGGVYENDGSYIRRDGCYSTFTFRLK